MGTVYDFFASYVHTLSMSTMEPNTQTKLNARTSSLTWSPCHGCIGIDRYSYLVSLPQSITAPSLFLAKRMDGISWSMSHHHANALCPPSPGGPGAPLHHHLSTPQAILSALCITHTLPS